MSEPAKGILAAALTPLDANLAPDHAGLAAHCRWLLAHGCDGLAVLGTTGEANSFTVAERLEILERLVAAQIPPRTLLPGTGCCALPDTIALTRKVVELGLRGALVLPPFYYKNVSDDGLYAAFARIVEGVGDARLRLYLYHFPQLAMVPITRPVIERLLRDFPNIVVGMKDSSGDAAHMCAIARDYPGFAVLAGADDCLYPLLKAGGAGCITAVANLAAPLAAELYRVWDDADRAEPINVRLCGVRAVFSKYPLQSALKEIMARHSGQAGWRRLRPPLMPLAPERTQALAGELAAIGFAPPPLA